MICVTTSQARPSTRTCHLSSRLCWLWPARGAGPTPLLLQLGMLPAKSPLLSAKMSPTCS